MTNKKINPVNPDNIVKETANKKRHDDIFFQRDNDLLNFRCNMLLLREFYRVFFRGSKVKFITFYDAIGISQDIFDNFIRCNSKLSPNNYRNLCDALDPTVLPQKYYKESRARLYRISKQTTKYLNSYFTAKPNEDKLYYLKEIRTSILEALNYGEEKATQLTFVCYELANKATPTSKTTLWKASEILQKIIETDLSDEDMDSEDFDNYILTLANSVGKLEEKFPDFYALVQMQKNNQDVPSLMHEISSKLSQLKNLDISQADANSISCLNMMNEISETMLKIQNAITL